MLGIEVDLVVKDCQSALEVYEKVFGAIRKSLTSLEPGLNEALFTLWGTNFHLLDANPEYHLMAPQEGITLPVFFNVTVPNLKVVYQKALDEGFQIIQPPKRVADKDIINALVLDPFGYVWVIHEFEDDAFEDRR